METTRSGREWNPSMVNVCVVRMIDGEFLTVSHWGCVCAVSELNNGHSENM